MINHKTLRMDPSWWPKHPEVVPPTEAMKPSKLIDAQKVEGGGQGLGLGECPSKDQSLAQTTDQHDRPFFGRSFIYGQDIDGAYDFSPHY